MTNKKPQIYRLENIIQWMVVATFLIAIKYIADALQFITSDSLNHHLYITELALGFMTVFVVAPSALRLLYLRYTGEFSHYEPESFIVDIFRKTCVRAFVSTILFTIVVRKVERFDVYELPTKFTLDIILAFALASFSLIFLYYQWTLLKLEAEDEDEFCDEPIK